MASGSFVANGNLYPSRFVKPDTAVGKVTQAGAGEVTCGVTQQGTRNTPYSSLDDGYCAIAGENVRVYQVGEECYLESGAAITVGALLKPSTNGVAIAVAANNDWYGARARQTCAAAGVLIRCVVEEGYYGA